MRKEKQQNEILLFVWFLDEDEKGLDEYKKAAMQILLQKKSASIHTWKNN